MKYKAIGITSLAVIIVLGSINWQYVFGIDTQNAAISIGTHLKKRPAKQRTPAANFAHTCP